jgi:hypothetical protein
MVSEVAMDPRQCNRIGGAGTDTSALFGLAKSASVLNAKRHWFRRARE